MPEATEPVVILAAQALTAVVTVPGAVVMQVMAPQIPAAVEAVVITWEVTKGVLEVADLVL